jgi:hypothetical protein
MVNDLDNCNICNWLEYEAQREPAPRHGLVTQILANYASSAWKRLFTRAALETLINLTLQSLHSLGLVLDPRDTSEHYSVTL